MGSVRAVMMVYLFRDGMEELDSTRIGSDEELTAWEDLCFVRTEQAIRTWASKGRDVVISSWEQATYLRVVHVVKGRPVHLQLANLSQHTPWSK